MSNSDTLPLVVLISGSGSNLQALIDAVERSDIRGEIRAVISNQADAFGLQRAQRSGIPTEVIDHRHFDDRRNFDHALRQRIESYQAELVVLAGFMRILTEEMIQTFNGRMLNIHPSLLPRFRGLHTHRRALEAGDKMHGCSVHFVTDELDGGPLIIQARVPILPDDDPDTLAARVLTKEHIIYPLSVQWFCEGRLLLKDGIVHKDGEPLSGPIRLEDTVAM